MEATGCVQVKPPAAQLLDERSRCSHCSTCMNDLFFSCALLVISVASLFLDSSLERLSPASLSTNSSVEDKHTTLFVRVVACLLPQPCLSALIPHSLCYINEEDSSDAVFFGHLHSSLCMNEPLLVSWETINKILNKTHAFLYCHEAVCFKC